MLSAKRGVGDRGKTAANLVRDFGNARLLWVSGQGRLQLRCIGPCFPKNLPPRAPGGALYWRRSAAQIFRHAQGIYVLIERHAAEDGASRFPAMPAIASAESVNFDLGRRGVIVLNQFIEIFRPFRVLAAWSGDYRGQLRVRSRCRNI